VSARRIALALVLLATLLGPAPARAQGADPPQIEDVPDAIEQLLADYSRAWREKDAALLASTLTPELAPREAKALANAAEVSFTTFEVTASTQYSGNLASPRVRARYRGQDVRTYEIEERSQIGFETTPYEDPGAFTFTRGAERGAYDGWRLAGKNDLDVLGFFSPLHMWDIAPVKVLTSKRFIVLAFADAVEPLRSVLDIAESAYDRDAEFWPEPLTDRFVMIVPTTTEQLRRIMHETVALEKFVAFVAAGSEREAGWTPTGPRIFVHLDHLKNYHRGPQLEIIAHELIHAVTRDEAGPNVPSWVEEGLANFGGGSGGRPLRIPPGTSSDAFPSDDQFFAGPVRDIQTVYDKAQIAIQVLDERFGRQGIVRFYEELGSRRVVAGTEEYHVRDAIRKSVGWSYDDWVAAWRERLQNPR
jgi:hypothetical protein